MRKRLKRERGRGKEEEELNEKTDEGIGRIGRREWEEEEEE